MIQRLRDAQIVLMAVAEFDSRFENLTPPERQSRAEAWAMVIGQTNLTLDELRSGVIRAYSTAQRPLNPVGAIIEEAKQARLAARRYEQPALPAAPYTPYGRAIPEIYEHNGAGYLQCPTCRAEGGKPCVEDGQVKKIPHVDRLALAYRTNDPEGRRIHQEREEHLRQHRANYQPTWRKRQERST